MTADAIMGALDDALAIRDEHEGAGLNQQLHALGLEREQVELALEQRWAVQPEGSDLPSFVRGFTEGLLAMVRL